MTKRYKILQKKMKELKAELILVFSLPGEKTPYHQLLSEDIEQRFLFIKNLLSAEIASNPSKPHHLYHVVQRLTELETAFREWDDRHRTTSAAAVNNFDHDTTSVCSCDHSCRNDDGEAYYNNDVMPPDYFDFNSVYDEVQEGGLSFPEGLVDVNVEQELVKKVETARGDVIIMKREKRKGCCEGMISGMIFGGGLMAVIMLRFSACFYFAVHESFLIPT